MEINSSVLKPEEQIAFSLRELYHAYGYLPYKMSKFEQYDLYVRNRDFLVGSNILTFTDTNGKLMALKPDITLSIIKNYRGGQQKVYYNETVYREGGGSHEFREIMQAGLECIGEIDLYSQAEVLLLAEESLGRISPEHILDIASVGVLSGLMSATPTDPAVKRELLACVAGKNLHNVRALCCCNGVPADIAEVWEKLATLYGPLGDILPQLSALCVNEEMSAACGELSALCRVLERSAAGVRLNIDFSIVSDLRYYNGLVFKGYIPGVPASVLSGGRYDNLVRSMGKNAGAIGFAVYLDLLETLRAPAAEYDADVLVAYRPDTPAERVIARVRELRAQGATVKVQSRPDEKGSFRRRLDIGKSEEKDDA